MFPLPSVGVGLLTRPPSVDCDARRARRLGAPPYRVLPCGASFFPRDGKETKGSPGETHIAVGNKFPPAPVRSPPDPRNLRGPNSRGLPVTVRRGRDNDCPRNRAAAAAAPKSRRPGQLDQTGAPDCSRSNLCGGESAGYTSPAPRRGGTPARPSPIHGNGSVRRTPTRPLCHGWSEPGAAVKWCRPKFCAAPGPSGPEGINTWNRILCAGNFAEGRRGIPRKRGSGGSDYGRGRPSEPTPGGVLVPFSPRKKELAQRAKPCESSRRVVAPYGCHGLRRAVGHMGPTLQRLRRITAGRENWRGNPLPYEVPGKHPPAENRRALLHRMKPPPGGTSPYTEGQFWSLFCSPVIRWGTSGRSAR